MSKIVIAFDSTDSFFQSCADKVAECAVVNNFDFEKKCGESLTKEKVASTVKEEPRPNVLTAFSHGDNYGYANESKELYVDRQDDSLYSFDGNIIYTMACQSGNDELVAEMKRKGVLVYWGYDCAFVYFRDDVYAEKVISGIKSMLEGKTIREAKTALIENLTEYAENLGNPLYKGMVLNNINNLVVYGDEDLVLNNQK